VKQIRRIIRRLFSGNRTHESAPDVNFAASDEGEFQEQISSWKGSLSQAGERDFNPESSKYFSSSALSESRRVRLDRKRAERESSAKSPKRSRKTSK